jgi:NitT/TauT family transport system permease protein
MNAIGLHDMDVIMSVTLLLALFAGLINAGLLMLDRHLHRAPVQATMLGG